MERKIPLLAVAGPTASGKTSLGIALAKKYGGEIVSCDSMQIYRGLPIGTAQPTPEETALVPHHLVAFRDAREGFSVSDYVDAASETIRMLDLKGKLPVLVGGTGQYLRSLLQGFSFDERCRDETLREELFRRAETEGPEVLYSELERLDPVGAQGIHPHNVKRLIRALEYCILAQEPFSAQAERSRTAEPPYSFLLLCLAFRDREKLYRRIDLRVDQMLENGLLSEAEYFWKLCAEWKKKPTAAQAIGYKELFPYFEGKVSLEDAVENLKRESRRYAKRQITWFSREPDAHYLYVDDYPDREDLLEECVCLIDHSGICR